MVPRFGSHFLQYNSKEEVYRLNKGHTHTHTHTHTLTNAFKVLKGSSYNLYFYTKEMPVSA
jgi:hypothetical protein